jgi:hypothetical protein
MENLVTLKIEYSVVHIRFLRYICHRSPLKNISLRGSRTRPFLEVSFESPHPPPPPAGRVGLQQLKVLDLSDTGVDAMSFIRTLIVGNVNCQLTRLYLERCNVNPFVAARITPTVEFVSIAGYAPSTHGYHDLRAWARLSSMKEINASGLDRNIMSDARRDSLIRQHPNVVFDLSEDFRESHRFF